MRLQEGEFVSGLFVIEVEGMDIWHFRLFYLTLHPKYNKMNMKKLNIDKCKCALFDLDGVVFDTETQYSIFWGGEARRYHPEIPGLEYKIKGMPLTEIYETYFADVRDEWDDITGRLNEFEKSMKYDYINGFLPFIDHLRKAGIKCAVVTSSNRPKMESVARQRPELSDLFDAILTAEDFTKGKPDPDCYLMGMARFGCTKDETIVFEDSINGLKSGRASGAYVVGLATTNPADVVAEYSDLVIRDFAEVG